MSSGVRNHILYGQENCWHGVRAIPVREQSRTLSCYKRFELFYLSVKDSVQEVRTDQKAASEDLRLGNVKSRRSGSRGVFAVLCPTRFVFCPALNTVHRRSLHLTSWNLNNKPAPDLTYPQAQVWSRLEQYHNQKQAFPACVCGRNHITAVCYTLRCVGFLF